MKRIADEAQELIDTIWTDAEYRAMIEEQHWQAMKKRYERLEPLPVVEEEPTEEVGLPSDMVFRFAVVAASALLVVGLLILGRN